MKAMLLALCSVFLAKRAWAAGDPANGKARYEKSCSQCHGDSGDGKGPASPRLRPKPRDFTSGAYKVRSTPNGELPTDEDIYRAVADGLPGTAMPAWAGVFSDREIRDLVAYLKTFNDRFQEEQPSRVFEIKGPKKATPQSMARGREIYLELGCSQCHGQEGRGDGSSAPTLTDDAGDPLPPANFHEGWHFRGGHRAEDIFRTIMTGFNGTPMPSFIDALGDNPEGQDKAWDLANYVRSLSPDEPHTSEVLRLKFRQALPDTPEDPSFRELDAVHFPLFGQIVQEPRQFTPAIHHLEARGFYNEEAAVILLQWHDRAPDLGKTKGAVPDAVEVQVPWAWVPDSQEGEKPYFLEGDAGHPVSLWRWDAGAERVVHWKARGLSSSPEAVTGPSLFVSSSAYSDGEWRLVLKRPLAATPGQGLSLEPGVFFPAAFSAWDASNGDAGAKRSVSSWYWLLLEPQRPKTAGAYPVAAFLLVGALEFWFLRGRAPRE